MQIIILLPKFFKAFIAVMTLMSIFGGFQLSQYIYGMSDTYLQRANKLLEMESSLNDSTIALGQQIQEWKDMLLRANDAKLFNKHREAFLASTTSVQEALGRTKTSMLENGMDTGKIEQLINEHQALLSDYLLAKTLLHPGQKDTFHEVDKQAIGVDRNLQQHISIVKTDIETFAKQQLEGAKLTQEKRLLLGLLGTMSLLIMSLLGVFFVSYFPNNTTAKATSLASS